MDKIKKLILLVFVVMGCGQPEANLTDRLTSMKSPVIVVSSDFNGGYLLAKDSTGRLERFDCRCMSTFKVGDTIK